MSKFDPSRQNRLRTRLWKCFCYGELDYDIPEGSNGAFFSETPVVAAKAGIKPWIFIDDLNAQRRAPY